MATVCIYNNRTGQIEWHERALNDPMPYNRNGSLTVREFRGSSCSSIFWSDVLTMEAWNATRQAFGQPIPVGYAFKRIWEGGHSAQSQHYAGTSFDTGQRLSAAERNRLRETATRTGVWSYVEPAYLTPTWVHFDRRFPNPACPTGGYPLLRRGVRNMYVFILQDALNALGYNTYGLDGIFGVDTQNAVLWFQGDAGIAVDGAVGCNTWRTLTGLTLGIGQTPGVEWKCR